MQIVDLEYELLVMEGFGATRSGNMHVDQSLSPLVDVRWTERMLVVTKVGTYLELLLRYKMYWALECC